MSNCWDCGHQQSGYCTWFRSRKKIPMHIVDKGCSYYRQRTSEDVKADNIITHIIDVFDGEILKREPIRKTYKRKKYVKSKHKYGERKDW